MRVYVCVCICISRARFAFLYSYALCVLVPYGTSTMCVQSQSFFHVQNLPSQCCVNAKMNGNKYRIFEKVGNDIELSI